MNRLSIEATTTHPGFSWDTKQLEKFFAELNKHRPLGEGELSIVFLDTQEITQLHARFLNDSTPTDVITFPGDPEMESLGEICVCVDVALSQASVHNHTFSQELTLYLVHGWLHLVGFDDKFLEDQAAMRAAEVQALEALRGFIPVFVLSVSVPRHLHSKLESGEREI